jgi:hypothetical protein
MAVRLLVLWSTACVAGGCATERITAVEEIDSGTLDAGNVHDEAPIDVGMDASIEGSADASSDGQDGVLSSEAGSDANADSSACDKPVFVTSSPFGIWKTDAGYNVFNNEWNTDAGPGPQTLYACSYRSWYVVSNQAGDAETPKTYPNVQMNFSDVPIRSFHGITSTFIEASPHVGAYEDTYDIWLNGVATPGSAQILIWVDNYNRVPEGSQVARTTLGGRTYDVWKTSDNLHIVLVSTVSFSSGTLDLLEIFNWTVAQGWMPSGSTLGQIDFGVEIASTSGANATFLVNDFSITTN